MKELLADYLQIPVEEIRIYKFDEDNCSIDDGDISTYSKVEIYEPAYRIHTNLTSYYVTLEELLLFLYSKIKEK